MFIKQIRISYSRKKYFSNWNVFIIFHTFTLLYYFLIFFSQSFFSFRLSLESHQELLFRIYKCVYDVIFLLIMLFHGHLSGLELGTSVLPVKLLKPLDYLCCCMYMRETQYTRFLKWSCITAGQIIRECLLKNAV